MLRSALCATVQRAAKAVLRAAVYNVSPPDLCFIDVRNNAGEDALALALSAGHNLLAEWLVALGARGAGGMAGAELSSDAPHAPRSARVAPRERQRRQHRGQGAQRQQQQQRLGVQHFEEQQQLGQATYGWGPGVGGAMPMMQAMPGDSANAWAAAAAALGGAAADRDAVASLGREVESLRTELGFAADEAAAARDAAAARARSEEAAMAEAAQERAEREAERARVAGERSEERAAVLEGLGLAEARALRLAKLNASIKARYENLRRTAVAAVGKTRLLSRELRAERARRDADAAAARQTRVEAEDSAYSAGYMEGYKEGLAAAERKLKAHEVPSHARSAAAAEAAAEAAAAARNPLAGTEEPLDGALLTEAGLAPTLDLEGEEAPARPRVTTVGLARPPRAVAGEPLATNMPPKPKASPFTAFGSERLAEAATLAEREKAGGGGLSMGGGLSLSGLAARAAEAAKMYIGPLVKSAVELASTPADENDALAVSSTTEKWAAEADHWIEDECAAANEDFEAIETGRMDGEIAQAQRQAADAAARTMLSTG